MKIIDGIIDRLERIGVIKLMLLGFMAGIGLALIQDILELFV